MFSQIMAKFFDEKLFSLVEDENNFESNRSNAHKTESNKSMFIKSKWEEIDPDQYGRN